MKMANEKKSIIEEALLEAQAIDATFKSNAKEILAHTMSSEIEEMVKESLNGSKRKRLKEDEEEGLDLNLDLDSDDDDEELDLDLDTEEGVEGSDDEFNFDSDDEEGEDLEGGDLDLDADDEGEGLDLGGEGSDDLDLGGLDLGGDNADLDLDLGGEGMGDETETIDLTGASDSDVVSVFKKMGPEDEIEVVNDNGMVTLKDNKSGSEYRIELNTGAGAPSVEMGGGLEGLGLTEGEEEDEEEEIIYEIEVDEDEDVDFMSDYMNDDSMEDEMSYMNAPSTMEDDDDDMTPPKGPWEGHFEHKPKNNLPDYDDSQTTDFMSRVKSTRSRYNTNNRNNPEAIDRMGGSESYRATYGESKAPQITKLIKENTDLNTKNTTLVSENGELVATQEKMVDALKQFRKKLQEVAVFNSNLTYAVRLITENTTTKDEKQEILKRLDSAKDLKESQSIYKQLVKEYSSGKTPIKESIDEKINKTASSGAQISEQSVFVHPELAQMKKLWSYDYKK
jgi:hypothetical protein